jgi:hypothetical protein
MKSMIFLRAAGSATGSARQGENVSKTRSATSGAFELP